MIRSVKGDDVLILDEEDADLAGHWTPYNTSSSRMRYARGSIRGMKDIHRIVASRAGLDIVGKDIDHRNRNGLDNRRSNLRLATKQQNQFNVGPRATNASGLKGVSPGRRKGTWVAQIRIDGKQTYLGTFDTPEGASSAYLARARQLHGEFIGPGQ